MMPPDAPDNLRIVISNQRGDKNMQKRKREIVCVSAMMMCVIFAAAVMAGGPPLKDNVCNACHAL